MSKHNDQLLPCPFCGCQLARNDRKHNPYARCPTEGCKGAQLPLLNLDQPDDVKAWQARAKLPAGGVVPDENDCVIGGYAFLAIRGQDELHVTVDPTERLANARADHWREKGFVCGVKPIKIPVSILAAAPHPVSSEQSIDQNNAAYWQEQYHLLRKDYQRSLDERAQDVSGLAAFALGLIDGALEGGSFDGGDIQELAEKNGLLVKSQREESCGENCGCAEYGFPLECYRVAPALAAHRAQAQGGDAKPECKCSMRTRLVGDGCSVCNPDLAAEYAKDDDV